MARSVTTLGLSATLASCTTVDQGTNGGTVSTYIEPHRAVQVLKDGNARYLSGDVRAHDWLHERVVQTGAEGQSPSIGVLTCADSRTPPEFIFDQGIGSLFVVRDAGNILTDTAIGTFEYGVTSLGVHTIVVLGHTKCGAVMATVAGRELPGKMSAFVAAIKPALAGVPKGADGEMSLRDAEIANVRWQAAQLLKCSEILSKANDEGKLPVLCAIYDVDTGIVRFLD
ncbi:MAG: carbonic anhydrase [Phycisphaerales bacterium]|nr:carbonic anhydrase [Phycisphaerales bacterium]